MKMPDIFLLEKNAFPRVEVSRIKNTFGKKKITEKSQHTVDGRNPANQLRLVVYPVIYRLFTSEVVGRISAINNRSRKPNIGMDDPNSKCRWGSFQKSS